MTLNLFSAEGATVVVTLLVMMQQSIANLLGAGDPSFCSVKEKHAIYFSPSTTRFIVTFADDTAAILVFFVVLPFGRLTFTARCYA